MKVCSKCKISKDYSLFSKKSRAKDGLYHLCKPCDREAQRHAYQRRGLPGTYYISKSFQATREYIKEIKESNPCVDCNRKYPFYIMDFDHLTPGTKQKNVSACRTIESAKIEIAKCDLVCANCHRERTHNRPPVQRKK